MKYKFTTAFGLITAYKSYDYYQFTQLSDELRKKVEPLSLQTVHHLDKLPYSILMADNQLFFTTFVKDVFDGAAMDYTLVKSVDEIRKELPDMPVEIVKPKLTYGQWAWYSIFGWPSDPETIEKPSVTLIAVGPKSLQKVLYTIQKQYTVKEVVPEVKLVVPEVPKEEPKPEESTEEKKDEVEQPTEAPIEPTEAPLEPTEVPKIVKLPQKLPEIAYIPYEDITGWKNMPLRIYRWFHTRHTLEKLSSQILAAVYETEARPVKDVLESEWKQSMLLHPSLLDKLNVYTPRVEEQQEAEK